MANCILGGNVVLSRHSAQLLEQDALTQTGVCAQTAQSVRGLIHSEKQGGGKGREGAEGQNHHLIAHLNQRKANYIVLKQRGNDASSCDG